MKRLAVLSAPAARDLDEILSHVHEKSGPGPVAKLIERFEAIFSRLARSPGLGHRRADLNDDSLRVWILFSYLIIYRPGADRIEIVRILHGARDIGAAMRHPR